MLADELPLRRSDCSGANTIKVTGDDNQKTWNLLNGTYEYCSSFQADPDPPATITVCEVSPTPTRPLLIDCG